MTSLLSPELVGLLQAERERELRRTSVARSLRQALTCCSEDISRMARLVQRVRRNGGR